MEKEGGSSAVYVMLDDSDSSTSTSKHMSDHYSTWDEDALDSYNDTEDHDKEKEMEKKKEKEKEEKKEKIDEAIFVDGAGYIGYSISSDDDATEENVKGGYMEKGGGIGSGYSTALPNEPPLPSLSSSSSSSTSSASSSRVSISSPSSVPSAPAPPPGPMTSSNPPLLTSSGRKLNSSTYLRTSDSGLPLLSFPHSFISSRSSLIFVEFHLSIVCREGAAIKERRRHQERPAA